MKITRASENVLQLRPLTGLYLVLFGMIFTFMGVAIFALFGTTSELVCERLEGGQTSGTLKKTLLGVTQSVRSVEGLQGARIDASDDDDGGEVYDIVLITGGGDIHFTGFYSSGYDKKEELLREITEFVRDTGRPSLRVRQSGNLAILFLAIFGAFGLAAGFFGLKSCFTKWTFDRTSGFLRRRREGFFKVTIDEFLLRDIMNVHLAESRSGKGTTYRIEIDLAGGATIPMTTWYSSGKADKEKTIAAIRKFLDCKRARLDFEE